MHADAAAIIQDVLSEVPDDLRAAEALLDVLISALCLQLVRVQARISANAPVSHIPDDVLTQIFTHACRPPTSAPHTATSATTAALAGTNRRWRALILGHPALWTRVDLRHPSGAWALRYSRRLPLYVRLDAPLWKDVRDGPLARTLAPHVPRLRQLWIQTGAVHAEAFLRAIAGQSQLERLTLTGRYTDEHAIILPPTLLSRLRHLSLTHAHLASSTQLPQGLLSLVLKPPPAATPLALASLATLLRASPGLTELALYGSAVPVYKSPGDEDHSARADLARLRSLRVSGVGPVQVAWLLFHITYPASANLTLEMELPRPLRTAAHDRPRAPHELESYLAALALFSGEPRERGMPLDIVSISPAASTSSAPVNSSAQPPSPTDKDKPAVGQIAMERLAAQYTTTSATLTLQAGSRATEALVRLIAGGGAPGSNAGISGMSGLVLSGVKIRHTALESLPTNSGTGQDGLSQARTLEIRACSLAASGGGFAIPQRPGLGQTQGRARAQTQSVPPTPYSVPPTPYNVPSTPAQQASLPSTPKLGPTHIPHPSQSSSNPYGPGPNSNGEDTYPSINGTTPYISGAPLGTPHLPSKTPFTTPWTTNATLTTPHVSAVPLATPSIPEAPLSTPNIPGVHLTPNAPPAPTPPAESAVMPNAFGPPPSNLYTPAIPNQPVTNLTTPTPIILPKPNDETPKFNTRSSGKAKEGSSDAGTAHTSSEKDAVNKDAHTSESVYSADTTLASVGTGSGLRSDSDSNTDTDTEEGDEDEDEVGVRDNKEANPNLRLNMHAQTKKEGNVEGAEESDSGSDTDADAGDNSSSSDDGQTQKGDRSVADEEDETDSNEADGGSELGGLVIDDIDDRRPGGIITPGHERTKGRPGTPGPRRGPTESGAGGSTSSVNGGTTPRMSGANTPLASGSEGHTPNGIATSQVPGVDTPKLNPYLQNLRNGLHSASMSNIRAAATGQGFLSSTHSASSSNLHASFKSVPRDPSSAPQNASSYKQSAFGPANTNTNRGRSTIPNPKQGATTYGFASYATGTSIAGFGTAPVKSTSGSGTAAPFSSTRPSFSTIHRPTFASAQSSFSATQSSFYAFRNQHPQAPLPALHHDDDSDIHLLSALSLHMPALEDIRIIRSTVRGSTLIRFIEARNGTPDGFGHTGYHEDGSDSDTESSSDSDDPERDTRMSSETTRVKKARVARAGPGAPILSLELLECPYVTAEHVRALRKSVDDVRWKPYAPTSGARDV